MDTQVGKWGNSLAVRIPKFVASELNLQINDRLLVTCVEGKVILEPVRELAEFTLEELLSQVKEPPEGEIDWGQAEGEEIYCLKMFCEELNP